MEDYLYVYTLGDGMTDSDIKDYLKDLNIEANQVNDELFEEYWERTGGVPDELRDAVKELKDATDDVEDGLDEICENNEDLNDATGSIMDAYLEKTEEALAGYGQSVNLTEDNYAKEIDKIIKAVPPMKSAFFFIDIRHEIVMYAN